MSTGTIPAESDLSDTVAADMPARSTKEQSTSHAEALASTSIMGGSAAVVILMRMIRTKLLAALLGPVGIGLEAIFDSVLTLTKTAVDLGVSSSGVRQIAAAVGSGDQQVVAATVITLRRVCMLLGGLGAGALFLLREPISQLAFGNVDHARDLGWLAVIPLLGGIAGGQGALLQGMRRIGDLAKVNILGAAAAVVLTIPIVWIWGKQGIPAYLILTALTGLSVSCWYARKLPIATVHIPIRQTVNEARRLLQLGLVFVSSGLMTTGVLFLLRVLVARQEGVDGAGQFQAASALSMVYVGFILQAMGTDFYPRLTAVATDDRRCNQLVNEQAEISILLALPGVLATLALAPWVIHIFYSEKFGMAAEILCWQIAGMLLRVNSWPMGFIVLAKGRAAALFWTDLAAYTVYAALGWLGLRLFGLPGTGMAFLGLYLFHWCLIYTVVRRISGFRWSTGNLRLSLLAVTTTTILLCARLTLPEPWPTAVGGVMVMFTGLYCLKTLVRLVGADIITQHLQKLTAPFRLRRSERAALSAQIVSD